MTAKVPGQRKMCLRGEGVLGTMQALDTRTLCQCVWHILRYLLFYVGILDFTKVPMVNVVLFRKPFLASVGL